MQVSGWHRNSLTAIDCSCKKKKKKLSKKLYLSVSSKKSLPSPIFFLLFQFKAFPCREEGEKKNKIKIWIFQEKEKRNLYWCGQFTVTLFIIFHAECLFYRIFCIASHLFSLKKKKKTSVLFSSLFIVLYIFFLFGLRDFFFWGTIYYYFLYIFHHYQ